MKRQVPFLFILNTAQMSVSFTSELPDGGARAYLACGYDATKPHKQATPPQLADGEQGKTSLSFTQRPSGDFIFTVWHTGVSGDCVEFVQRMRECTASEAIAFIRSVYGDSIKPGVAEVKDRGTIARKWLQNISEAETRDTMSANEGRVKISGRYECVTENTKALRHLIQKSGGFILPELLKHYNVLVIREYETAKVSEDGEYYDIKKHDCERSRIENPFIAFTADMAHVDNDGKLVIDDVGFFEQIKAPFTTLSFSTWRYVCDYVQKEVQEKRIHYSFGFNALSGGTHYLEGGTIHEYVHPCYETDTVYLTEGETDCLALNGALFPSVTYGGGIRKLNEQHLKQLKREKMKRVVVVFDVDKAGREFSSSLMSHRAEYLQEGIELHCVTLPKLSGAKDDKDVCDYLRKYGCDDDFKRALTAWQNGGDGGDGGNNPNNGKPLDDSGQQRTYTRRGDYIEMSVINVQGHVSEAHNEIVKALCEHSRVQVCAGTGTGKTFEAVELAKKISSEPFQYTEDELQSKFGAHIPFNEPNFRTVIALPTTLAVHQASERYGIPGLYSGNALDETAMAEAVKGAVVVTTYDSLHRCGDFDLLIVDEMHEVSKAFNYRAEAVTRVFNYIKNRCKYVLALTATPEPVITKALDLHTVKIETPRRQHLNIIPHYMKDEIETAVSISKRDRFLQSIIEQCEKENARGNVAVLRYNSKDKIEAIKKCLEEKGIRGVYTMTRDQKSIEEPVYRSIIENDCLPTDCKVLLSTCVLDTAVNIRGKNFAVIIACDGANKDADNIVQFTARFRDMEQLDVHLMFQKHGKETLRMKTAWQLFNEKVCEQGNAAAALNYLKAMNSTWLVSTVKAEAIHDKDGCKWHEAEGMFQVSEPWCISQAVSESKEKTDADTLNELQQMAAARITDVTFNDAVYSEGVQDVHMIGQAVAEVEKERQDIHQETVQLITEHETAFMTAIHSRTKDIKLKAKLQDAYGTTLLLQNDESEQMCNEYQRVIEEPRTEKVVKQYLDDKADGFNADDAVTLAQAVSGSNSRHFFKQHLKVLQCYHTAAELLKPEDRMLKEHIERIVSAFQPGERVTSDELRRRVVECGSVETMRTKEKNIVSLVRVLFNAERYGKKKDWKLNEIQSIEAFCKAYNVSPPRAMTAAFATEWQG